MAIAREEILLLWKSDISGVIQSLQDIRGRMAQLSTDVPGGELFFKGINQDISNIERLQAEVRRLEGDLQRVQAARARSAGPGDLQLGAHQAELLKEAQRIQGQLAAARRAGTEAQIQAEQKVTAELSRQEALARVQSATAKAMIAACVAGEKASSQAAQKAAEALAAQKVAEAQAAERAAATQARMDVSMGERLEPVSLQNQIREELVMRALEERRLSATERLNALLGQQETLYGRILKNLSPREAEAALRQINQGQARLFQLEQQRLGVLRQMETLYLRQKGAQKDAISDAFARMRAGETDVALPRVDVDSGDQLELNRLLEKQAGILRLAQQAATALNAQLGRRERLAAATGATESLEVLEQRINETRRELETLVSPQALQALQALSPQLTRLAQQVAETGRQFRAQKQNTAEADIAQRKYTEAMRAYELELRRIGMAGLPELLPTIDVGDLKPLERNLLNMFSGVGQRFITSLQYAFSGFAIYAATRLAKEFVQAVIEVERAFADIGTAIEFDVGPDAARGTVAFEQQVESVRRQILGLSEELNVLPTVANEAAYVMIARFGNTGLAMEALRYQLLATKVATIDQAEALRALTAVGETFGRSTAENLSVLSFEQQQLAHQVAAVNAYGRALDFAVYMQERYGVATEDVLEGTANLAEIFSQLGFSLEEVGASVGLVSQRMGTTGAQATDRLGRSIGQISTAAIRDELLALAAASDTFSLNVADFTSGANAMRVIGDQFERVRTLEPETAAAITQIIGQRREAPTVAAYLATYEEATEAVRNAGDAAGAAERRFGFLQLTISEIVDSIIAQFQALAQNLAQLGVVNPFQLMLSAVDKLLTLINALLNVINDVGMALESMGFPSLDEWIFGLTAGIALLKTLSVVGAAARTALQVQGMFGEVAGAIGDIAGVRAMPITAKVAQGAEARALAGSMSIFGKATEGLDKIVKSATTAIKTAAVATWSWRVSIGAASIAMGQWLIGIGALVLAAYVVISQLREQEKLDKERATRLKETNALSRTAAAEAERLAKAEGATPAEAKVAGLRAGAETFAAAAAETETPTKYWQIQGQAYDRAAFDAAVKSELATANFWDKVSYWLSGGSEIPITGKPRIRTGIEQEAVLEITPGTTQWYEAQNLEGLQDAATEEIRAGRDLVAKAFDKIGEEFTANDLFKWNTLLVQLRSAASPEEVDAIVAQAGLLREEFRKPLEQAGFVLETIEGDLKTFQNRISQAGLDVQLGRITQSQFAKRIEKQAANFQEVADTFREMGLNKEAEEAQMMADQAILQGIQARTASFERQIQMLQGLPEETALIEEADILSAELEYLASTGQRGTQLWVDTYLRRQQALDRLAEMEIEQAIEVLERRQELTTTTAEYIAVSRQLEALYKRLERQAIQDDKDQAKAADFRHRRAVSQKESAEKALDLATREIVAKTRLSGPILSRLVVVQAEIASIDYRLAHESLDYAEKLELNLRLKELLAETSRIEVETARAYVRATVSSRNELERLRHELAVITKEMIAVREAYGENSAEWYDVVGRMKETEVAIEDQVVAIRDVRRRLGSDITNSFLQAQNDILLIMDQLALPDLGKLEKAQLQLDLQQAKAAAQRAFIDQKLFDLEFLYARGELTTTGYINALKSLRANVDTTSQQGKELWLQLTQLIEGMVSDVGDLAFNIPSEIRMPTLYETRAAVQARQMRVQYQDQRRQNIRILVTDKVSAREVLALLGEQGIYVEAGRYSNSNSALTFGG